ETQHKSVSTRFKRSHPNHVAIFLGAPRVDGSSFPVNNNPEKETMKTPITKLIKLSLTATLFGLCVVTPLVAGLHGNSHAFGKTAAGWIEVYERWAFGELAVPIDENGNAVVDRHVEIGRAH